mmetsp:Transcript_14293/g.42645  ORF Transcript_14293/g.42645 Transcript_14293/m.42645 type:complete len:216 (-) Transcript_14293:258-905(-)
MRGSPGPPPTTERELRRHECPSRRPAARPSEEVAVDALPLRLHRRLGLLGAAHRPRLGVALDLDLDEALVFALVLDLGVVLLVVVGRVPVRQERHAVAVLRRDLLRAAVLVAALEGELAVAALEDEAHVDVRELGLVEVAVVQIDLDRLRVGVDALHVQVGVVRDAPDAGTDHPADEQAAADGEAAARRVAAHAALALAGALAFAGARTLAAAHG